MTTAKESRQLLDLLRHFSTAYPIRSTLIVLSITVAALAEGLGIASLLPLINLVVEPDGANNTLTLYVAQAFDFVGLELSIGGLLIVIVAMIATKSLLVLLATTQVGYSAAHVAMNLRLELIRALLNARWQHFVDQRTGELASAVSNEPVRTANAYVYSCRALAVALQLLVYLALSLAISWEVSIAALVVGAFSIAALDRFIRMSSRAGRTQTHLQKSFMTRLLQGLDGMKPLKAMACEGKFTPLIESDVRGLNRAHRTIVISQEAVVESHEIIRILTVAGGLYVFLTVWSQPIDSLFVLAFLFARTLGKVSVLQNSYQIVAFNLPAFAFLRSTIASAHRAPEPNPGGVTPHFTSAIALRDVSFSYGVRNVLDHVSMVLPAGKFIAIVGASGVGKTTVADLIIGLLRPQSGDVWIDDLPMRDADIRTWRGMIGYVPQGNVPVPRHDHGERHVGRRGNISRSGRKCAAPRRGVGFRRHTAGRHGVGGRRARRAALRWPETTHRHRPSADPRPCSADSRRGHHRAGPRDGGGNRGHGAAPGRQGHGAFDLSPACDETCG